MEPEEIFINLKVLEQLQKNQKLISRGQYINIEPVSILPEFIRRWHRQDNRNETLVKLNLIVNSAIDYINKYEKNISNEHKENKKHKEIKEYEDNIDFTVIKKKEGHEMTIYLENSITGIQNLKETYATCTQTCARLDILINKIKDKLNIK